MAELRWRAKLAGACVGSPGRRSGVRSVQARYSRGQTGQETGAPDDPANGGGQVGLRSLLRSNILGLLSHTTSFSSSKTLGLRSRVAVQCNDDVTPP
ncbi:hypothetical protein RRG08_038229 [Elysia crispata]|uniref:Uncharacterized protein n=1 Tax=Elysia crispata TaxID=231223 RepID=A0AAE1E2S6_9GAST|nr:hypothetical protein RRG08_038229 [Elysia crispata]